MSLAVQLLLGNCSESNIEIVSADSGIDIAACSMLTHAVASLFWEFIKSGTSNQATISAILLQLGLSQDFAETFSQVASRYILLSC